MKEAQVFGIWLLAALLILFGLDSICLLFRIAFAIVWFIPSLIFGSSQDADLVDQEEISSGGGFFSFLFYLVVMIGLYYGALFALQFKFPAAKNLLYKSQIFPMGLVTMVLSKDFKWKKPVPNAAAIANLPDEEKTFRKIVFIRHGESEWNEVFNRGMKGFFGRLLNAIIKECKLLTTRDSVFIDASLCEEGMEQAAELREFLSHPQPDCEDPKMIEILRGADTAGVQDSVIVCSNLRRAAGTAALGLRQRLHRTQERVYLLSCLQEISRNVDANASSRPGEIPDLHVIKTGMWDGFEPERLFDAQYNAGQKSFRNSNGYIRMLEFCKWAFNQEKSTVIVGGGHSFYFRAFFQTFMDRNSDFIGCKNILQNGAVVSFTLERGNFRDREYFRIQPDVRVLFKDFKTKK